MYIWYTYALFSLGYPEFRFSSWNLHKSDAAPFNSVFLLLSLSLAARICFSLGPSAAVGKVGMGWAPLCGVTRGSPAALQPGEGARGPGILDLTLVSPVPLVRKLSVLSPSFHF